MNLKDFCKELETQIISAYETSVTIEEAEKLAAKFLHAQMLIADELKVKDLDARMRKSGVKAIKAAVYMENATKGDKKPSDVMLGSIVDMSELVQNAQTGFDEAEVDADSLRNYLNIFKEGHIYFRNVARGSLG